MVILKKKDIDVILSEIKKHALVERLRLTTGNCGVFAIALRKLLRDGDLWGIGGHTHFVLFLEDQDMYVDGVGKMTHTQLIETWGTYGELYPNDDEEDILRCTCHTLSLQQMVNVLVKLSKGESVEYYTNNRNWIPR